MVICFLPPLLSCTTVSDIEKDSTIAQILWGEAIAAQIVRRAQNIEDCATSGSWIRRRFACYLVGLNLLCVLFTLICKAGTDMVSSAACMLTSSYLQCCSDTQVLIMLALVPVLPRGRCSCTGGVNEGQAANLRQQTQLAIHQCHLRRNVSMKFGYIGG